MKPSWFNLFAYGCSMRLICSSAYLLLILTALGVFAPGAFSQQHDSELDLILRGNVGSSTPFWLQYNRYDLISDQPGGQLGVRYQERMHFDDDTRLILGTELYGRTDNAFLDRPIHQVYVGLNYRNLLLTVGKREETVGVVQQGVSAGPTIWSGNARPMPKIKLELTEFSPLPFTDGWLSVKGGLAHGWFDSGRVVEDFYLHEKYVYLQVGKRPWPSAYVGLIHMAQWGGYDNARFGQLPDRFNDYMRVFFGKEGDERSPEGWQVNKIGNHLGAWQAGIHYTMGQTDLLLNRSAIFEDGSGLTLRSAIDGLWGINVRHWHGSSSQSRSGGGSEVVGSGSSGFGSGGSRLGSRLGSLSGLGAGGSALGSGLNSGGVGSGSVSYTSLIWEFWHTKFQSGPGLHVPPDGWEGDPHRDEQGNRFGGWDNYFNHSVYRHWTYHGRIIGVPLITFDPDQDRVINNRLIAHHVGIEHRTRSFAVRGTYTWSKNYGTYETPFRESNRVYQHYLLFSVENTLEPWLGAPLLISLEAGLDWGELTGNRSGLLLTLEYHILR